MVAIFDFSILSKLLKGDSSTPVWISLWGCQTWVIKREKNCIKQNKVYPHGCQTTPAVRFIEVMLRYSTVAQTRHFIKHLLHDFTKHLLHDFTISSTI